MDLPKPNGTLRRMRDARLRKLHDIGPCLAGSLVQFPNHNSRYLTDKVKGKTRTMYIPLDRLDEVKQWNTNHKQAKQLLDELSQIQRALLQGEIQAARLSHRSS